jgi:hypothetical protein
MGRAVTTFGAAGFALLAAGLVGWLATVLVFLAGSATTRALGGAAWAMGKKKIKQQTMGFKGRSVGFQFETLDPTCIPMACPSANWISP